MAPIERTLTINLRQEIIGVPRYKRAKRAVSALRKFLQQHMKAAEENVKIGKYLNLKLWEHGIKNPVTKLTVIAKKDDKGIVTAELPNIPVKPKSSEARLGPVDESRLGKQKTQKESAQKAEKAKSAKPAEEKAAATVKTTATPTPAETASTAAKKA